MPKTLIVFILCKIEIEVLRHWFLFQSVILTDELDYVILHFHVALRQVVYGSFLLCILSNMSAFIQNKFT